MYFEHLHLTLANNASTLNGIERKPPFLFCLFLCLSLVSYHQRPFVSTKPFIVAALWFSYVSMTSVKKRLSKRTRYKSLWIFFFLINIVIVLRYTILCLFFTSAQVEGSFKQIYNPCTVGIFKVLLYITLNGFFGNGR